MNCIPPSRCKARKKAQKRWHTSTSLLLLRAFMLGILTAASIGKETSVFDLSIQGLVIGLLEEMEHCLTITSYCRPYSW